MALPEDLYTKLKLFDSGQAHAKVAAGKAQWSDTFKPDNDRHCGTMMVVADYEYQLEMYLEEAIQEFPDAVLVVCEEMGRSWAREGQRFVPVNTSA